MPKTSTDLSDDGCSPNVCFYWRFKSIKSWKWELLHLKSGSDWTRSRKCCFLISANRPLTAWLVYWLNLEEAVTVFSTVICNQQQQQQHNIDEWASTNRLQELNYSKKLSHIILWLIYHKFEINWELGKIHSAFFLNLWNDRKWNSVAPLFCAD